MVTNGKSLPFFITYEPLKCGRIQPNFFCKFLPLVRNFKQKRPFFTILPFFTIFLNYVRAFRVW